MDRDFLDEGENAINPAGRLFSSTPSPWLTSPRKAPAVGGEPSVSRFMRQASQRQLPHLIATLYTAGSLTGRLDCGEQQSDQTGDDSDDDEQFDQRKT